MTASSRNLLLSWLASAKTELEGLGFEVRVQAQSRSMTATAVDLDGPSHVGTISYWLPDTFEFQFNARESGEVELLETKRFSTIDGLAQYVQDLLRRLDSRG